MFADPLKNLKQLGLREDMIVVDLGAGTGFYAIPAGKIVYGGKVYAVEIIRDYIKTIREKVKEAGLNNLECLWGDVEKLGGTKLKDKLADVVIASNILFQTEDRTGFIAELKRILKPNGKVLFIDWSDSVSSFGPKKDKIISKEKALELFARKGIYPEKDIEAGEHHYGMILVNKDI